MIDERKFNLIVRAFSQMASCGLPDNVCVCFNLKDGGKLIANLCIAVSAISCIMLLVYLFSDFDSIAREIADNNEDMVEILKQSKTCECRGFQWRSGCGVKEFFYEK